MGTTEPLAIEAFLPSLRAHCESLFPRPCSACGRQYLSFSEYVIQTTPVGAPVRFQDRQHPGELLDTLSLANCACGSTLSVTCGDLASAEYRAFVATLQADAARTGLTEVELLTRLRDRIRQSVQEQEGRTADPDSSRRMLETLMGNLPGMAYRCRVDADWTMEFVSAGCRELTGYAPEDLMGNAKTSFGQLTHPDDSPRLWDEVQAAIAQRRPFVVEYRIRDASGNWHWAWEKGVAVESPNGDLHLEGFITDITRLKQTQEAYQKSERRYRALVDNLEDVVFALDANGQITYMSKAVERFGWNQAEVVGQPIWKFVHPQDLAKAGEGLVSTLAGDSRPLEFRALDALGEVHVVRVLSRVMEGEREGEPRVVTGVLIDVTEQRRAEEQLRMAQKMEAVGQLAGGVAHDFNNMLMVINSCADFALEDLPAVELVRSHIEEIRLAGDRAAQLTRQLLAFGRRQVLQPEVVDLDRVVAGLQTMLQRLLGADIALEVCLASQPACAMVDPGQIEQCVVNLVVNARDAMPAGGHVTLETVRMELDGQANDGHGPMPPGPYVRLRVSDDGAGMDAQTLSQAFQPFFTTKDKARGTGLGLSTTYGIVQQSGGFIWADSEPGRGATFSIFLPEAVGQVCAPESERPNGLPTGDEVVLLVEDEPVVRDLAGRLLARAGYEVLSADGPERALKLFAENHERIQLVLTDVVMPGMSGRQLADRLQAQRPDLKVLFMSGYSGDAVAQHGVLEAGTHFIGKPFTAAELARKVRGVLDAPDGESIPR
jgi:PAS domain S-box-containing protein